MVRSQKVEPDLFGNIPLPVAALGAQERLTCLRLIRSENIGPATFRNLINLCGGADAALAALPEIARRGGRRRPFRICPIAKAEAELAAADAIGSHPLFTIEPGYPKVLAAIDHPPPLIYAKGEVATLNQLAIAIVGSRNCSGAGAAFARQLASEIGSSGFVITSGLARGIDGAAHRSAIQTGTVAVLAGGLDINYPPEHADLQLQIAETGCLVTECPPGFKPRGKDFPRRNRIISGMSLGVVVIEAAKRSGSLTTARFAAEQGRDVFAVPGHPLDPRAAGTNALLKTGAILATSSEDIIAELAPQLRRDDRANLTPKEELNEQCAPHYTDIDVGIQERELITSLLTKTPISLDEIFRLSGLHPKQIQAIVLELTLAGRLEHHGQNMISLGQFSN
ncbi:MAG: DNA-processing protein DprA [Pseudomonadota bacterium]